MSQGTYDPDSVEPCHGEVHPYVDLAARLRQDSDYAWGWHCVAACAAMDEGVDPDTANRIASRMMRIMFDVTTQHPDCSLADGGRHDPARLAQYSKRSLWEMLKEP